MPKTKKPRSSPKAVPYVKGFRPATARKQLSAIGPDASSEFLPQGDHFNPIPKCVSIDDWLAQYKVKGRTYEDFLCQTSWLSRRKVKYTKQRFVSEGDNLPAKYPDGVIYILPLGTSDNNGKSRDFEALLEYTQIFFGLPVKTLPLVKLELDNGRVYWVDETRGGQEIFREQIKSRYNAATGHYQVCVDQSLLKLRCYLPDDGICMIALTTCDLYEAKPDLFVAGMAAGNHRVAIFSLYRYDPDLTFSQEFWYRITRKKRHSAAEHKRLLLMRSCRLIVHEISHLLGVAHCVFFECCMNGSGHLEEDFRQPMFLCPVDLRKLQKLCGFDVLERYNRIIEFYKKHNMADDAKWYQKRIEYLKPQETS